MMETIEIIELKEIFTKIITILIPLGLMSTTMNLFMKLLRGGVFDKKIKEEVKKELEIEEKIKENLEEYVEADTFEEDEELIQKYNNRKKYIEL